MWSMIALICFFIIRALNASQAPVLSYFKNAQSGDHRLVTIGQILESETFTKTLKKNLKSELDLILLGQQLRAEDLSIQLSKYDFGKNVHFEPQVQSAYSSLDSYLKENDRIKVNLHKMNDLNEAVSLFDELTKTSSAIVLTSKNGNSLRKRRNVAADGNSTHTAFIYGETCAAYFDAVHFLDLASQSSNNEPDYLQIDEEESSFDCSSNSSQLLTIKFAPNQGIGGQSIDSMRLAFSLSPNSLYWMLNESRIVFSNATNSFQSLIYMGAPYRMETPLSYSFVCTKTSFQLIKPTEVKSNSRIWFYIDRLQLQPINVGVNGTGYTFGRVNYCQGFFSSGIWMAITSSLILTFILAFGISLLFNVKPLDRFDDPKGKPLNIGAEK